MPTLRFHGGTPVTSRPPISSRPDWCWLKPAMRRSSVDLPEPEGPSSAKNSPGSTVSDDVAQHLRRAVGELDVARFDADLCLMAAVAPVASSR